MSGSAAYCDTWSIAEARSLAREALW